MASAGMILDLDSSLQYFTKTYSIYTVILFSILMLIVIIPWKIYDKWMKNVIIEVNQNYIKLIKTSLLILGILSIISILYCLPYAIKAMIMGGHEVRTGTEGGLLPANSLTTLVSAVAGLSPFGILFFFITMLEKKLRKYSLLTLLLPIASIVHSMACAARELYIYLPITFIILYLMFFRSLSHKDTQKIKRIGMIMLIFLIIFFVTISISRFGEVGSDSFISGTWGYIYQQPYVFDQNLRYFNNFYEFDRRLMFLGTLLGIGDKSYEFYDPIEWSFGTMYSEFFQMFGYKSLFIGSICYFLFFYIMSIKSIRKNSPFTVVINFTLFIWFTISGLFYFRYGDTSYFLLYLFISIASFYTPKILRTKNSSKLS